MPTPVIAATPVQSLHLKREAPLYPGNLTRDAPLLRHRANHRSSQERAWHHRRPGSNSAIVLPLSSRSHQHAEIGPHPSTGEPSPVRAAIRPVPVAAGESVSDRPRPSAVIIDFALAPRSRQAVRIPEEPSSENPISLTLANLVAIIYALGAMAFYP